MEQLLDTSEAAPELPASAICPICQQTNDARSRCMHARWTFGQGSPLDFARHALDASPYVRAIGRRPNELTAGWWEANGDWAAGLVLELFYAHDGFVFGDVGMLDTLAQRIWKRFAPDAERGPGLRVDPDPVTRA